jgi:hypothetical protein
LPACSRRRAVGRLSCDGRVSLRLRNETQGMVLAEAMAGVFPWSPCARRGRGRRRRRGERFSPACMNWRILGALSRAARSGPSAARHGDAARRRAAVFDSSVPRRRCNCMEPFWRSAGAP